MERQLGHIRKENPRLASGVFLLYNFTRVGAGLPGRIMIGSGQSNSRMENFRKDLECRKKFLSLYYKTHHYEN